MLQQFYRFLSLKVALYIFVFMYDGFYEMTLFYYMYVCINVYVYVHLCICIYIYILETGKAIKEERRNLNLFKLILGHFGSFQCH